MLMITNQNPLKSCRALLNGICIGNWSVQETIRSDFLVIYTSGCSSHEWKLEKSLSCSQVQLIPNCFEKEDRFPISIISIIRKKKNYPLSIVHSRECHNSKEIHHRITQDAPSNPSTKIMLSLVLNHRRQEGLHH